MCPNAIGNTYLKNCKYYPQIMEVGEFLISRTSELSRHFWLALFILKTVINPQKPVKY